MTVLPLPVEASRGLDGACIVGRGCGLLSFIPAGLLVLIGRCWVVHRVDICLADLAEYVDDLERDRGELLRLSPPMVVAGVLVTVMVGL